MKLLATILALVLSGVMAFGQSRTIKGRLINADDRTPIPGWNVIEPGTQNGTVTDINGEFALTLTSSPAIIWFPQCFTQLYVEYEDQVDFKEIVLATDSKGQIFSDSKKAERKLKAARPTRDLWGEVVDRKSKEAIGGCEVRVKGTDNVVFTDDKGHFMIKVPNNKPIELELSKGATHARVTYGVEQDSRYIRLRTRE